MSESLTRKRIANMWNGITGVVTRFQQIPREIQVAQLPASVIFPGVATYDTQTLGEQMVIDDRIYEMVLYIAEAALGTSGQGEITADPFFDQVRDYFLARPGLELDSQGANQSESAYDASPLGDGGLQIGPYPIAGEGSPKFVQIRWRLRVKEISAIVYRD